MPTRTLQSTSAHPVLRLEERQRCEIWTRVMGYHRPVVSFNIGKQGEFWERKYFAEPASGTCSSEVHRA
jgi:hypothetical protein